MRRVIEEASVGRLSNGKEGGSLDHGYKLEVWYLTPAYFCIFVIRTSIRRIRIMEIWTLAYIRVQRAHVYTRRPRMQSVLIHVCTLSIKRSRPAEKSGAMQL